MKSGKFSSKFAFSSIKSNYYLKITFYKPLKFTKFNLIRLLAV